MSFVQIYQSFAKKKGSFVTVRLVSGEEHHGEILSTSSEMMTISEHFNVDGVKTPKTTIIQLVHVTSVTTEVSNQT